MYEQWRFWGSDILCLWSWLLVISGNWPCWSEQGKYLFSRGQETCFYYLFQVILCTFQWRKCLHFRFTIWKTLQTIPAKPSHLFPEETFKYCWQHLWSKYVCVRNHMKCTIFFQLVILISVINCSIWYFYWRYWTTPRLHWSSIESKECFFSRCSAQVVR